MESFFRHAEGEEGEHRSMRLAVAYAHNTQLWFSVLSEPACGLSDTEGEKVLSCLFVGLACLGQCSVAQNKKPIVWH